MRDEGNTRFLSFESFLFVISLLYWGIIKLRNFLYKKEILKSGRLPCKVISVGNVTVGGTGKTPMTIYMTELLNRLGYKVVILSRGYKGGAEKTGGIVSDGRTIFMEPDMAGDEPFMLAEKLKNTPVIVGKNRLEAGMLAVEKFKPDIIVLDDAFQHLKLARDINLVLLDSHRPFGNTHILPRGTLREPLSALLRGDAFILTRSDSPPLNPYDLPGLPFSRTDLIGNKPVFRSFHVPYICNVVRQNPVASGYPVSVSYDAEFLKNRNVFAFSGIAKNDDFQRTLEAFGCRITGFLKFPDHYQYSDNDLSEIFHSTQELNADAIITTEKDYVRLVRRITWPIDLVVISIKISFGDDDDAFTRFIAQSLY